MAAECGRQVLVHSSTSFEVGDHALQKPHRSASLLIFLMTLQGLVILGRCMCSLDTTFEAPSWDGTEIVSILGERAIDYPVVACTLMGGQTLVDVY